MPTTTPVSQRSRKTRNKTNVGPDQWPQWTEHLATRKRPQGLRELLDTGRTSPLQWPLHAEFPGSESARLVSYLERFKSPSARGNGELARQLEAWLDDAPRRAPTALFGIECLAWAHAMPALAQLLPAAPWCQLLDQLVAISRDAAGICLTDNPLGQQLLCGELPLSLAYLFPEVEACASLAEPARAALNDGIVELLDGEGLIHCRFYSAMRPLLASWTRCGCLGRAIRQPCFNQAARDQFEWLVRETIRLSRGDGSQALLFDDSGRWSPSLLETALSLISSRVDTAIAAAALPKSKKTDATKTAKKSGDKKTGDKKRKTPKLPEASVHSEWAGTAVLKHSWNRTDETLVVAYQQQEVTCELNCGSETLWSGSWNFQVEVDGKRLAVIDDWEEVCWVCDEDVAYVELEAKLNDGWRLQRQFLLARDDRFLLVADALLGNRSAHIDYQAIVPLASQLAFEPADETREGRVVGKRRLATVLPLELPEWRLPPQGGSLEQTDDGLVLSQATDGLRMFTPLFIDLDPRRSRQPVTWRQLTVAQSLEIAPGDEAVGYRVQIGQQQWLIYRSLGPNANRSLLGQNYSGEFIVARFPVEGEAEKLIEIE